LVAFDSKAFREALGGFATGVAVATTAAGGERAGMTITSFNSVSLDPPLVLWSLARAARAVRLFEAAEFFSVSVLAEDQAALSDRFARQGNDKFAGLDLEQTPEGVPVLTGCVARFDCATWRHHDGGDHLIVVGEVIRFARWERPPLVFAGGGYQRLMGQG